MSVIKEEGSKVQEIYLQLIKKNIHIQLLYTRWMNTMQCIAISRTLNSCTPLAIFTHTLIFTSTKHRSFCFCHCFTGNVSIDL